MTIRMPQAPAGGHGVVADALADIGAHPAMRSTFAAGAPEASDPIRVYVIELADIVSGKLTRAAKPAGWYYLVGFGDQVSIAELGADQPGGLAFRSLTRGHVPPRLAQALRVAERIAGGEKSESEIRLIDIPPLYVSAVWLHGENDRFIPFLDESRGRDFQVGFQSDFLSHVTALAERRIAAARTVGPDGS